MSGTDQGSVDPGSGNQGGRSPAAPGTGIVGEDHGTWHCRGCPFPVSKIMLYLAHGY
jgi:hypothetical protein